MSRARHKKAAGGRVYYSGGASKVADEAAETKSSFKKGGKVPGGKSKARMDKRARGGRVGGKSPFSSAASPTPKSMS